MAISRIRVAMFCLCGYYVVAAGVAIAPLDQGSGGVIWAAVVYWAAIVPNGIFLAAVRRLPSPWTLAAPLLGTALVSTALILFDRPQIHFFKWNYDVGMLFVEVGLGLAIISGSAFGWRTWRQSLVIVLDQKPRQRAAHAPMSIADLFLLTAWSAVVIVLALQMARRLDVAFDDSSAYYWIAFCLATILGPIAYAAASLGLSEDRSAMTRGAVLLGATVVAGFALLAHYAMAGPLRWISGLDVPFHEVLPIVEELWGNTFAFNELWLFIALSLFANVVLRIAGVRWMPRSVAAGLL